MTSTLERLDQAMVARKLVNSRNRAAQLIRSGRVSIRGHTVTKPGARVGSDDTIEIVESQDFVSRAGHKLAGFLQDLGTDGPVITNARCLDIGASTGGFTEVLLRGGAQHVVALDVGHSQLAPQILNDHRVTPMEGCNARYLSAHMLPWSPDLVVADVSFISLTLLLQPIRQVISPQGRALLLIKPQFEAGRQALNARGVVTDQQNRKTAITSVIRAAIQAGFMPRTVQPSHLPGPEGNIEYFVDLSVYDAGQISPDTVSDIPASVSDDIERAATMALAEVQQR